MAKDHLENDEFFSRLASLIEKTQQKGHGSVHLTQKRCKPSPAIVPDDGHRADDDPLGDLTQPATPLPIIIRATDGDSQSKDRKKNKNKVKLSTIVQPDDIEAFFAKYGDVCKAGMQSLKKRDRSKRKKDKKGKKKGASATATTG
ncbi:signal recognition particle, SRP9/SRP14 subunit [Polychaeton citri CBS 116435]|uniref:Signal recognition particle subunit SRP14 n=1 Tax=Polychaeton citri CBS 116435 TaxID=1314669 RepID=A0A9P4QDC6_9PEZI|nr:signal recognition particle, SRP9/SRP14 subunit [Polychaeton citri CBS 116435]